MKTYQLAILLYPGMTALDAIGPYEVLRTFEEIEVRFVWKEVGPIVTDSKVLVLGATHTFEQTPTPDIILIPGSSGDTAVMMKDRDVLQWIQRAHEHTLWTTSVCTGSLILGAAGFLDSKPATTHWFAMQTLRVLGATPQPKQRCVQSGKIVTAAGVSAGIDMALWLGAQLFGEHRAKVTQLWIEYDPQPPFQSGHPSLADKQVFDSANKAARKESLNARTVQALPQILLTRMKHKLTNLG